jgi:predicted ATPase/DNA-binding SARP family transcriptional activator
MKARRRAEESPMPTPDRPPPPVELRLLGPPELIVAGAPVAVERRKALALLAYLAVEPGDHPRDALAALLAPDDPPASARAGLRRALVALGPARPLVQTSGDRLGLRPGRPLDLDVDAFRAALAADDSPDGLVRLRAAAARYRGDFMAGFALSGSPTFEEWQFFQAERLRYELAGALERLSSPAAARLDLAAAVEAARRRVALDPLHEPAHRRLMELFAEAGQPAAALRQFRLLAETLERELGAAPDEATAALAEQLRLGERAPQGGSRWSSAPPRLSATQAPAAVAIDTSALPFLGREEELGRIAAALVDPACRMLTLIGPGGMGKTRLAVQGARENQGRFPDGVFQVSLVGVGSVERMLTAVSVALGLGGQGDTLERIVAALRERRALLLLDNADQIQDGALPLHALVQRTQQLKLLVTSRERLQLQEEWVVDLAGLPVPADADAPGAGDYSAVQLFVQRARQVRADFALTPEDLPAVVAICQLVEGMPLAIELAAAWVRVLTPAEIAGELEQSMALLTTTLKDVPERHRSVEGVFAQAWERLSPPEREALARLAVFEDGFTRVAAAEVAGATTLAIAGLADKALLRRDRTGRYAIHELLRQFAARKLAAAPAEERATLERFTGHYLRLLEARNVDLQGAHQRQALAELEVEYDNLWKAWEWAVDAARLDDLGRALDGMYRLHELRGWYTEGIQALELLIARLDAPGGPGDPDARALLVARARARLGALTCWVGQFATAERTLAAALPVLRARGAAADVAFTLTGMGIVAAERDDDGRARRLLDEGLAAYKVLGQSSGVAWALDSLGDLAGATGDYVRAKELLNESSTIFSALGDQISAAWSLSSLGRVLGLVGERHAARQLLQESLAIFEQLGDLHGAATSHANLGEIAFLDRDLAQARGFWLAALRQSREVGAAPLVLDALVGVALILADTGEPERAHELAALALAHEAAWQETLASARAVRDATAAALGPEAAAEAARRGRALTWEQAADALLG